MTNELKPFNFAHQLRDVITKIDITRDLQITHRDYPPLIIAKQYQNWIQQMSPKARDRFLTVKLQQYLYAIFNGDIKPNDTQPTATDPGFDESDRQAINCADKWYETKFYNQLTQHNHSRGYSDSGWLVTEKNPWRVSKNALTLNIDPQRDLTIPTTKLQVGQTVAIKMPPNLCDRGVYIAVGNAGSPNNSNSQNTVVQIYFNISSQTALLLLDSLTQQLNYLELPFEFKTAYSQLDFAKPDAAILEFLSKDWHKVQPVIKSTYLEHQAAFNLETLFFCKRLNPGLGLCEKPSISGERSKNIGQYYCNIVAELIVQMWKNNEKTDVTILNKKVKDKIKLNLLYLNLNSKDIYS